MLPITTRNDLIQSRQQLKTSLLISDLYEYVQYKYFLCFFIAVISFSQIHKITRNHIYRGLGVNSDRPGPLYTCHIPKKLIFQRIYRVELKENGILPFLVRPIYHGRCSESYLNKCIKFELHQSGLFRSLYFKNQSFEIVKCKYSKH